MPIARTLNQDFFKTWSPEMAYVFGFFAADGSMLENNRGACFIEFDITDKIVLTRIRRVIESNHKITERPRRNPRLKISYRIQIGSKEWFQDLTTLGFTQKKSKILEFPEVPEEYLGNFVRGYFDGDGCVYFKELQFADRTNTRWILMTLFTSGSELFLKTLLSRIRKYGVKGGNMQKKAGGFDVRFSHCDSLALYRLMYHTAEVSDLYLPRKREKLERAIQVLKLDRYNAGVA